MIKKLLTTAPWSVRCALTSGYGWRRKKLRESGVFSQSLVGFGERLSWSQVELLDFQEERLQLLTRNAFARSPFYRGLMNDRKLMPGDIKVLSDLEKLPILSKEQIRRNSQSLLIDGAKRSKLIRIKTGGSTGASLDVFLPRSMEQIQHAFLWARIRRHVKRGDRNALFTGRDLPIASRSTNSRYWLDNWADNQRLFSIFELGDDTSRHYVNALNQFRCEFVAGYQSAWGILANYMIASGLRLSAPIGHYFSSSEELLAENKAAIEGALGCQVWNHYGMNERVGAITQYECGHMHYDMDYGILEFEPIGKQDGLVLAKVIGTSLYNFDWPLIRYDTGDLVLLDPAEKGGCQDIAMPIVRKIFGRTGSFLQTPDGKRICNITTTSRLCRNFTQIQAVQTGPSSVVIRVIPTRDFTQRDVLEIKEAFESRLGRAMKLEVEATNQLEKTRSGKTPSIVNKVPELGPGAIDIH